MRAELHFGGDSLPERRVPRWGIVNGLDSTFVKRLPVGPLFGRLSSSGLCPFPVSSRDSGLAKYQRE